MIRILFFLILLIGFPTIAFIIGYKFGTKTNENLLPYNTKLYTIKFSKELVDDYYIKSSFITRNIVEFCDKIDISIEKLKLETFGECELRVKCTKDQYLLLIQELSDSKYMISIKNINF